MKKKKKPSVSKLKKKLWKLFSLYIRQRDADYRGIATCVSCGKQKHWKEGDAGHFIDGRHNSILFDPRNVNFQCKGCNGGLMRGREKPKDVKKNYERFMIRKYGQAVVDELKALDKQEKRFTPKELEDLIKHYREELKKYV